jgi:hypothetical protein
MAIEREEIKAAALGIASSACFVPLSNAFHEGNVQKGVLATVIGLVAGGWGLKEDGKSYAIGLVTGLAGIFYLAAGSNNHNTTSATPAVPAAQTAPAQPETGGDQPLCDYMDSKVRLIQDGNGKAVLVRPPNCKVVLKIE